MQNRATKASFQVNFLVKNFAKTYSDLVYIQIGSSQIGSTI